jgi:hypothetical protein
MEGGIETLLWISRISLLFCLLFCLYYLLRIIRAGRPRDYAKPSGSATSGVRYAYTGAMHPGRKESAYLHLPTYIAGLVYHAGTLMALLIFAWWISGLGIPAAVQPLIAILLAITAITGLSLLIKRAISGKLRSLSNPEDYVANFIVSLFQLILALDLWQGNISPILLITGSILLIYIPLGKLRHCVFFFAARYHLGYFYGSRGVWPPATQKLSQHG